MLYLLVLHAAHLDDGESHKNIVAAITALFFADIEEEREQLEEDPLEVDLCWVLKKYAAKVLTEDDTYVEVDAIYDIVYAIQERSKK